MLPTATRWCLAVALVLAAVRPAAAQRSPEEQLQALKAADGIEVSVFASEPLITNPAAIDVDTQGRVWVAEIQWYRSQAKEPPADKIKVLEDTDGDGRADKVTTFADGLFAPMSVCVAGDKVYVATSPDLWVFEDKNGDLKADGPPKKLLTGFGGYNHDHGAHSLVLGPDHKWWMSHGDTGFDVTGTDGSHIKYPWGAMLRGELDGSQLEMVAVNFRNPYEICVSSFGEAFCSDNDNDGNESVRICWILEDGNYGWFGHPPFVKHQVDDKLPPGLPFRDTWHFRGYLPGYVPGTLVTGFGSPCGICFNESNAFGPDYKNMPLHTDAGPREVRRYPHKPSGYGMKATSEVFLTSQDDPYFRPDDICVAPDGSLLVSDWYDGGVGGHAYNDPDRGRIFRLTPRGKKLERREKPGPYADVAGAIEGLKSPNLATQYLARERLLTDGEKSVPALVKLLDDAEPNYRARALWLLDRIGGDARQLVVQRLESDDSAERALAVRILRRHGDAYSGEILRRSDDESPEVKREVLLALPDLPGDKAANTLLKLARQYDGADRYQLEAINVAAEGRKPWLYEQLAKENSSLDQHGLLQALDPEAAFERLLANRAKYQDQEQFAQALLLAVERIDAPKAGQALLGLIGHGDLQPVYRRVAVNRLLENLGGKWKTLLDDPQAMEQVRAMLWDDELRPIVLAAVAERGIDRLAGEIRALAVSAEADSETRRQAVVALGRLNHDDSKQVLRKLLEDANPEVRPAALEALLAQQDPATVRELFTSDRFASEDRERWVRRLMRTGGGPWMLYRMLEENAGLPPEIRDRMIALAAEHPDAGVRTLYARFLPEEKRPITLGAAIKPADILALAGDAKRGAAIFEHSSAAQCKSCHAIRGHGGQIGPELTTIGRKYERATLLETILEPSKAIAPEYVPHLVETTEGQVFLGFLVERNDRQVVLKDAKGHTTRVPSDQVAEIVPQQTSLMPELVLRDITAQDAADLLAFLMTLK